MTASAATRRSDWTRPPEPDELDDAERLSVDELRQLQLQRLQQTLRLAYDNVGHYRRVFDAAGVHPDDCRSVDDLAHFPVTTKDDLRANYPFGMFATPRGQISRIHASSGTTGKPTVVGYTAADVDVWSTVVARSLRAAGVRAGHLVHVAYGYGLFTGGLGAHYGAERLGCAVVPASGGMTARQVQLITDLEPEVIMVTPTYMLTLLDEFERQGIDAARSSLRVGVFGAEPWTEQLRVEIEERAGVHAVDIYGLSEVIGPGVAQECVETKDGLHIWEDHFFPEVIDPVDGDLLGPGERGELLLTSLTKTGMPIIRYRTRDLTRLRPGTARPAMRRMDKVTGRTDDLLIVRGVNVFPTQVEEIVLAVDGLAPHFQLLLATRDRTDTLTVRVEARSDTATDRVAAATELSGRVKDAVGLSVEVEVVEPDALERSVGKLQRVIDERAR